jgi:hypothetical protein
MCLPACLSNLPPCSTACLPACLRNCLPAQFAWLAPMLDLPLGTLPPQMHKNKLRKLGERTSSAEWTHDRLTWQEDITYKKELGYL